MVKRGGKHQDKPEVSKALDDLINEYKSLPYGDDEKQINKLKAEIIADMLQACGYNASKVYRMLHPNANERSCKANYHRIFSEEVLTAVRQRVSDNIRMLNEAYGEKLETIGTQGFLLKNLMSLYDDCDNYETKRKILMDIATLSGLVIAKKESRTGKLDTVSDKELDKILKGASSDPNSALIS